MQAEDVDATELNGGIMAMVKEVKGKIAPDSMAALEMFESAISDPLEEESGQVGDSSRGPDRP